MRGADLCAIGDSFVEGRGDTGTDGAFRGWVPRLAGQLGLRSTRVRNLGEHGATTSMVCSDQLARAVAGRPPLVGVIVGVNDLVSDYHPRRFAENLSTIHSTLNATGATVFTASYPDIPGRLPVPPAFTELLRDRFAHANEVLADVCRATGTLLLDIAVEPRWDSDAVWSADGLHPNASGHSLFAQTVAERIAHTRDTDLAA